MFSCEEFSEKQSGKRWTDSGEQFYSPFRSNALIGFLRFSLCPSVPSVLNL
jgi:hypothetical protein